MLLIIEFLTEEFNLKSYKIINQFEFTNYDNSKALLQ